MMHQVKKICYFGFVSSAMNAFFPPAAWLLLCLYISSGQFLSAQDYCMGARYRALGNTGTADTSAWAVWNNPAGTSRVKEIHCFVSDELLYGIHDIRSFAAGAVIPVKQRFILGISLQKQGYQWFNDQQIGLHIAHAIGMYSLSGSVLLWQRIAGETYHELYPLINLGGIIAVNHSMQLGIHLYNISNSQNREQTLPFQVKLGLLYTLSKETVLYADIIKRLDHTPDLRMGIEYRIHAHFFMRGGILARPLRMNGGIGFQIRRYAFDYSVSWQSPLGNRHQLSVRIFFNRKS